MDQLFDHRSDAADEARVADAHGLVVAVPGQRDGMGAAAGAEDLSAAAAVMPSAEKGEVGVAVHAIGSHLVRHPHRVTSVSRLGGELQRDVVGQNLLSTVH